MICDEGQAMTIIIFMKIVSNCFKGIKNYFNLNYYVKRDKGRNQIGKQGCQYLSKANWPLLEMMYIGTSPLPQAKTILKAEAASI